MTEQPATTDHPVPVKRTRKRATKKVAETVEVVSSANIEEAVAAEPAENVISAPEKKPSPSTSAMQNDNGVFVSPGADRALAKPVAAAVEPEPTETKVAVWSDKHIRWSGVGALIKGYNIVTKEAADKWLSRSGIREATPEEVAAHYGK